MSGAVTIADVETILTQPGRSRLVIVKVVTSDDGLYGLGCATFTQRVFAVEAAIERHLTQIERMFAGDPPARPPSPMKLEIDAQVRPRQTT